MDSTDLSPRFNIKQSGTCLEFRNVDMASIPVLQDFIEKYPSRSCDLSIGGILMWADYFHYQYAVLHDTLFLKGFDSTSNNFIYYMPTGKLDIASALSLLRHHARKNLQFGILISPEQSEYPDSSSLCADYISEWREYLYPIERFISFAGKKMEKKRNHLNYFRNHYPEITVKPITPALLPDLIDFTKCFSAIHSDSPMAEYESRQTIEVLKNFDSYPFFGVALTDRDKLIGYSFGEKTGDTFLVHVEKGDISYRGIYQAVASSMATAASQRFPGLAWLNREEDMGDESLRKSKESYHPTALVLKRQILLPDCIYNPQDETSRGYGN